MKSTRWMSPLVVGLALGLLALPGHSSPGQAPRAKVPMAWEYRTVFERGSGDPSAMLNEWGQQGWELVAVVVRPGSGTSVFYFKRPKP